jgi:hypothetical protein
LLLSRQRAREASAFIKNNKRRPLCEPLDRPIVTCFQVGGPLFLNRFSEGFFSETWCQMEPQMASKRSQNLIKNELETKSTKHVENVLNLISLELQETRFRMERLSKTTKTRGADKSKQIQTNCVEMKPTSMKNRPQNSTKNDA